jgi:hypothetical protein
MWREVGLALLDMNDLYSLFNFCMTCQDLRRAMKREYEDLFGEPKTYTSFRSRHIVAMLCDPLMERLRRILTDDHSGRPPTSTWVIGGFGGDITRTIEQVAVAAAAADGNDGEHMHRMHPMHQNRMHQNRNIVLRYEDCKQCRCCYNDGTLRKLAFKRIRDRRAARLEGRELGRITVVLLGMNSVAWRCMSVRNWLSDHRTYRASIVFVSPQDPGNLPRMDIPYLDHVLRLDGVRIDYRGPF